MSALPPPDPRSAPLGRSRPAPPDGSAPFFVAGALWAAVAMAIWLLALDGVVSTPGPLAPLDWHAHELLYGYAPAVVVGYLLGIVPNWSGALPVRGAPRNALLALWVLGRVAMLWPDAPPAGAAALDCAFLLAALGLVAREVVVGRDRRSLRMLAPLGALAAGNLMFHAQAAGAGAAAGSGARLGIAALVLLIMLVGGALVPSFTRRWLAESGGEPLAATRPALERAAIGAGALALAAWVAAPAGGATGIALLVAGALHAARLARWRGWRTLAEPMVAALHAGYAFVPAGFVLLGAASFGAGRAADALHAWSAGAIGVMTLAVMSRVALRRARRDARGDGAVAVMLGAATIAGIARSAAGWAPQFAIGLAAGTWIGAFTSFVVLFGPMLVAPAPARRED